MKTAYNQEANGYKHMKYSKLQTTKSKPCYLKRRSC